MYPQVLNDCLKSAKENLKSVKEWIVDNPGEKKKELPHLEVIYIYIRVATSCNPISFMFMQRRDMLGLNWEHATFWKSSSMFHACTPDRYVRYISYLHLHVLGHKLKLQNNFNKYFLFRVVPWPTWNNATSSVLSRYLVTHSLFLETITWLTNLMPSFFSPFAPSLISIVMFRDRILWLIGGGCSLLVNPCQEVKVLYVVVENLNRYNSL